MLVRNFKRRRLYKRCLKKEYGAIESYLSLVNQYRLEENVSYRLQYTLLSHFDNIELFMTYVEQFMRCASNNNYFTTQLMDVGDRFPRRLDDYLTDQKGYTVAVGDVIETLWEHYRAFNENVETVEADKKDYYLRHHTKIVNETLSLVIMIENGFE